MRVPPVNPFKRLPPEVAKRVGAELVAEYNKGASVRQLCEMTGYSIGRVRKLLIDAGVTFRPVYGGKNPTGSKG